VRGGEEGGVLIETISHEEAVAGEEVTAPSISSVLIHIADCVC
jgi:hypothetical protein